MDIVLNFIDKIEYWQILSLSLILLLISTIIGDEDLLPWVSGSFFITGLLKLAGVTPSILLISFPFQLIILLYLAKPMLYSRKSASITPITEDINSMINQNVKVVSINPSKPFAGESTTPNGKKWKISHLNNQPLLIGNSYKCKSIDGLTLIVIEQNGENR